MSLTLYETQLTRTFYIYGLIRKVSVLQTAGQHISIAHARKHTHTGTNSSVSLKNFLFILFIFPEMLSDVLRVPSCILQVVTLRSKFREFNFKCKS